MTPQIIEDKLRSSVSQHLSFLETILYLGTGLLLCAAAISGVVAAGASLWREIADRTIVNHGLQVLDQLLLVLMLIEILHTVRISIRTQALVVVPFLIVGLIASIRRVLVITMQAARLGEQGKAAATDQAIAFRNSMIELGLLGILILVMVFSIYLLRRSSGRDDEPAGEDGPAG